MKKLNLNMSFEEIGNVKKSLCLKTVKGKTENEAHKYLDKFNEKHYKVKLLMHLVLKTQKYIII